MSQSGTDRAERGYRAANDALDERPSAATRAAILAAAARQVQAGPRDAASARVVPRRSSTLRWSLAAAASVLLSTLAVMMAVRTEQEMPSFTPGAEVSESRQAAAAAPAAPAASIPPEAAPATPASKPTEAELTAGAPAPSAATAESKRALAKERTEAAPAPATAPAAASADAAVASEQAAVKSQGDAKVTAPAELSRAREAIAASSVPASPAIALPPRDAARGDERLAAKTEAAQSMEDSARRNERAGTTGALSALRQAPAPASALGAAGTARIESDSRNDGGMRAESELRADDWLEKIIKLRAAGRHDEADAELKRFRERYPQVQVPPAALSATGTR